MNRTLVEHAVITLIVQVIFGLLLGDWVLGAAMAFVVGAWLAWLVARAARDSDPAHKQATSP